MGKGPLHDNVRLLRPLRLGEIEIIARLVHDHLTLLRFNCRNDRRDGVWIGPGVRREGDGAAGDDGHPAGGGLAGLL